MSGYSAFARRYFRLATVSLKRRQTGYASHHVTRIFVAFGEKYNHDRIYQRPGYMTTIEVVRTVL